ncbi:MAG: hypothetical protein COB66_02305 [Coxiella sp. (in: Bacteria)]|nr:MAG: hypothetical protein COB66_02305 [Coxiella sp. (in: g-proteobacteria)]
MFDQTLKGATLSCIQEGYPTVDFNEVFKVTGEQLKGVKKALKNLEEGEVLLCTDKRGTRLGLTNSFVKKGSDIYAIAVTGPFIKAGSFFSFTLAMRITTAVTMLRHLNRGRPFFGFRAPLLEAQEPMWSRGAQRLFSPASRDSRDSGDSGFDEATQPMIITYKGIGLDDFLEARILDFSKRFSGSEDGFFQWFMGLFIAMAENLKVFHDQNQIHGDVKDSNITLFLKGPIAQFIDLDTLTTLGKGVHFVGGERVGGESFEAPESRQRPFWKSKPSDVYGLGRVFSKCCFLLSRGYVDAAKLAPLKALIEAMTQKSPQDRVHLDNVIYKLQQCMRPDKSPYEGRWNYSDCTYPERKQAISHSFS